MQRIKTVMAVLAIVSLLCVPTLFAQQREQPPGRSPSAQSSRPGAQETTAPPIAPAEALPVPKASTFIGSSVTNAQGESLGKIDDLVIDPVTGRITYAALSYGSVLGLGGKLFAVSWESLRIQPDGKTFVLDLPKETLENAPGFDKGHWPKQPDSTLSAAAHGTGMGTRASRETAANPKGSTAQREPGSSTSDSTAQRETSASTSISATVQEVNAQKEMITVKTEHGENVQLQAPAAMLRGLQEGDAVEVKMVGSRATEIKKK